MQLLPAALAGAGNPAGYGARPPRRPLQDVQPGPIRVRIVAIACALLLGMACASAPVRADDLSIVQALVRQGNLTQATERLDAFLAGQPKDARGRFLRGLILTAQERPADAIRVFLALTDDYPELPEPYNNLAVLYAAQGQLDRARQLLESAIRAHPSYATAHENLGDVYARMASDAYHRALQFDPSSATMKTKLTLIRELLSARPPDRSSVLATTTHGLPAALAIPSAGSGNVPHAEREQAGP